MVEQQPPAQPKRRAVAANDDATATLPDGISKDAATATPLLSPGEWLAERFEIVACLGQGGMGQVFSAIDHELGEQVALKVIRPDRAARAGALERFKREVQLARQVTHANVCRIFDLFVDSGGSTAEWGEPRPPIFFITMELLAGETIAQRLERAGPLPPRQALPIIEQVAAGLGAAHRAQVVHRDFKSANVMLTSDRNPRAVVTDFGLAAISGGDSESAGTPSYAPPEQLAGGEPTAAADVYALGVVIHEMVSGHLPEFVDTRHTTDAPPVLDDRLPRTFRQAVGRCLERRPEDRFTSPGEVARALGTGRIVRRTVAAGIAAAIVAGIVGLGGWLRAPSPDPIADPQRPAVAILGLSGDEADRSIGATLSELLTLDLEVGGGVRAVTGRQTAGYRYRLPASASGDESLQAAGNRLAADYLIDGSYQVNGEAVRIELQLSRSDGEQFARFRMRGERTELPHLASAAADEVRRRLGLRLSSSHDGLRISGDPAALEALADGLARLERLDGAGAAERLDEAAQRSPHSPSVWSALAEAYALAGNDEQAVMAARTAVERASGLPRESRLRLEAQLRESEKNWPAAGELYRALWTFHPETLEYGLDLAAVETAGGDPQQALATIDELRHRRASPDVRIDLAEAEAAQARGELTRQLAAAERAVANGRAVGAEAMVAHALVIEAHALDALGRRQEAQVKAAEAGRFYAASGDRRAQARAVLALAERRAREPSAALGMSLSQALDAFRQAGDGEGEARALVLLARPALDRGEQELALASARQALELARAVGSRRAEAEALNLLGLYEYTVEELEKALPIFERALAAARASGSLRLVAGILGNLARTKELLAMNVEARDHLEEATQITRRNGSRFVHGLNVLSLGRSTLAQGDLASAVRLQEEALAVADQSQSELIRTQALWLESALLFWRGESERAISIGNRLIEERRTSGNGPDLMRSQLALTSFLLETGAWRAAERRLRAMLPELPLDRSSFQSKEVRLKLVEALLGQGELAPARQLLQAVSPLLRASEERALIIDRRALGAEIARLEGRPEQAIRELEALLADDSVWYVRRLQLRLQLGRAHAAAGAPARARAVLDAVRLEAETAGYLHFVRRAGTELARLSQPSLG